MSNPLIDMRDQLVEIDDQLIKLLSERNKIAQEVGKIKRHNNLPALDEVQAEKKQKNLIEVGKKYGLRSKFIRKIWRNIHHESVKIQKEIMGDVHLLQKLEAKKEKLEKRINKRNKK